MVTYGLFCSEQSNFDMFEIVISKHFARHFRKLSPDLQKEILDRLEKLQDPANHQRLKVHKLSGRLSEKYSFSVNYKIRIVFSFPVPNEIFLLLVGDHDIYK